MQITGRLTRTLVPSALLVALALATTAITLLVARSGSDAGAPAPYITGQSSNFLTRDQAMTHLRTYLATALWAETVYATAEEEPAQILSAMQAPIPLHCADPSRTPQEGDEGYLDCSRLAVHDAPTPPRWHTLPETGRTDAANRMLSNLWRATDPVERVRLTILWNEGVDPTDAEAIQQLQQEYDHCPEQMMNSRHRLIQAQSAEDMASAWMEIATRTEECADLTSTRLFKNGGAEPRPQGGTP